MASPTFTDRAASNFSLCMRNARSVLSICDLQQGFEEDDAQRSAFVRAITLDQMEEKRSTELEVISRSTIPKTLVRYWHDPIELPSDVQACLESWECLRDEGFALRTFDDVTAAAYIGWRYGDREEAAFSRCRHPAMRSDYLRMCFILAEGGFYVDADDVLLGDGWRRLFLDDRLKVQPLCYDVRSEGMVPAIEIWSADLPTADRIFYVNNDPIVAPAGHAVLARALDRATNRLLGADASPEIQSTTGPGNLTAVLAAHARELALENLPMDFELLQDWDRIAATRWNLSYRGDERNWRNMDAG